MKKTCSVTASVLMTTALLYGCGAKEKELSFEAISAPTKQSNIQGQGQKNVPQNGSDAASSATLSSIINNINTIEKADGGDYYYLAKPVNVLKEDWLTKFAGGRKNTIIIRTGQVIHKDNIENTEAYIEMEGKDSKITLIANGAYYEYDDSTHQIKRKIIDFLTGKKLVGKEVVKDYSDGKQKIVLIVHYNEKGIAAPQAIFCPQNDSEDIPKNNYYKLEVKD